MSDLHKIHEGPPPPESDYFVSDRGGNLVGWLVQVEACEHGHIDGHWNYESEYSKTPNWCPGAKIGGDK